MNTSTAEAPAGASSALEPVGQGVLALVTDGRPWTVADLADKLAPPISEDPAAVPFPKLPKPVELTEPLKAALRAIPKLFGSVRMGERRSLTPDEIRDITNEALAIQAAAKPLAARLEEISETIRVHMDADAERRGLAGPRPLVRAGRVVREASARILAGKAAGHYLLAKPGAPYEVAVPGRTKAWQQRYVDGGAAPSQARLDELHKAGEISRADYLACTVETRSLDAEKLAGLIRKDPARGLAVLKAITVRSAPSAALYAPPKE